MSKTGALPFQMIRDMINSNQIVNADIENINPSSFDLSITDEILRTDGMILPNRNEKVTDILDKINATEHDIKSPLEVGVHYLIKNKVTIELPNSVFSYGNPKSTSGRNNIHSRIVSDNEPMFDTISKGFNGDTWTHIIPSSFPIKLEPDMSFSQTRFCNRDTRLNQTEVEILNGKHQILYSPEENPINLEKIIEGGGSIYLTIDCSRGFECLGNNNVLDLSKRNQNPEDFFRIIENKNGSITLKRNRFYIFYTYEYVRIPPCLACEMRPMDPRFREFRSHFAGFIDPGWGYGKNGEKKGSPIVLEIIPYEDILIRNRQIIARIKVEKVIEEPEKHYDQLEKSNYTQHEKKFPKLSKHFDMSLI